MFVCDLFNCVFGILKCKFFKYMCGNFDIIDSKYIFNIINMNVKIRGDF